MLTTKIRTYKKSATKRKTKAAILPELPNFRSLFFGILIGIFVASLVVFMFSTSDITLKIPLGRKNNGSKNTVSVNIVKEADVPPTEPRFDFYTELVKNNPEPIPDLKSTVSPINEYLVQIGSYTKKVEADAVRAELTLNGYVAKIMATKQGEDIKHSVVLGPYKNKELAQKLQQELKLLTINSKLILRNME